MKVKLLFEMLTNCFDAEDEIAIIFYSKDEFEDEQEISSEIWSEVVEEFGASSASSSIDQQMREALEAIVFERINQ